VPNVQFSGTPTGNFARSHGVSMIFHSAKTLRRFASASTIAAALALSTAAFAAETYVFDKGHTEIRFSWSHFGVSKMSGMILDYQGGLNFDPASPENSKLDFAAKTNSIWTHVDKLNTHLKSPDFFDTAKYPDITFKSTKVEKISDTTGKITGDLTIKGMTKPVTLDTKKPALGFQATTTVKRTEFNLGYGAPAVSDEVEITINTEMNPEG
jgi:polyisoprenoid-binding protein YceI